MSKKYKYDVAISFAEEDRDAALALAQAFSREDIKVYYYPHKTAETLGDLKERLISIYRYEAHFAVVLLSGHYITPGKEYVQVELDAIRSRMKADAKTVYMVPVHLNGKGNGENDPLQHPAFKGKTYQEWNHEPEKIVSLILEMLGRKTNTNHAAGVAYEVSNTYTASNVTSNNANNNININMNNSHTKH